MPSDEMPNAMLKIRIVEGLKRMSRKPITPAVIIRGMRHGSLESMMMKCSVFFRVNIDS